MNVIEIEQASKKFRKNVFSPTNEVLENINLNLKQGEFLVLKGENGSGKTTLLNLILGLVKPTNGTVKLMGLSPQDSLSKMKIGYVLQNTGIPSNIKVKELISLWQSYYVNSLTIEEVLRKVDLEDQAESWATDLSGGQKQRLYFALALVGNPTLLILDEPTRNLDESGYNAFWKEIEKCREEGTTILMVTNNKSDQEKLDILKPRIVTLTKHSKVSGNSQLTENSEDISSTQITTADSLNQIKSPSYLKMLFQQINFEVKQILRTPLYLLGIFIVPFLIPFLLRLSGNTDDQRLSLTAICGIFLFTIVIDRFAKRIVVERSEKWLNLLKATPLSPILYIGAKLTAISLVCGVFTVTYFTLITSIAHIEVVNNLSTLISVLIIGIIPFGLLGITLGFVLEPKSADSILGYSLLLIPLLCWLLPIPIPDKFSWLKDILVLLPFYHYRTLVESVINNGSNSLIFLNTLWLIWATFLFYYLAVLSYQREKVIQR
ncbi:ATP-binding cassette domain-containing protein [Geminocystis sp. CENA526]|uniref:ATP-binding cassette domain-containing protein n=1 Tax=Geminocystis sp. CENA526 TaxID=1355871 RepID=UPI003D700EC6